MHVTEVRISLCSGPNAPPREARHPNHYNRLVAGGRLKAFCSITFDGAFVVRDVKLIEGNEGLFLAMPSRKLADHCTGCGEKNHLRARFCNGCGLRLDENRNASHRPAHAGRDKLHADIAHPANATCRHEIEAKVIAAYWREVERSERPGYVPATLDAEDFDFYDADSDRSADLRHGSAKRSEANDSPSNAPVVQGAFQ